MGLAALVLCWGIGAATSPRVFGKFQLIPETFRSLQAAAGERCEGIGKDTSLIKSGTTNCILGDTNAAPSFFILGDSHARMWTTGLDLLGKEYQFQGIALAYSSCTPISGYIQSKEYSSHCPEAINAAIDYIAQSPTQNIVLVGYWSYAIQVINNDNATNGQKIFYQKLSQILEKLKAAGKNIYFIYDIPELAHQKIIINKLLEVQRDGLKNAYITIPHSQKLERQQFAEGIKKLQIRYNFITLDPSQTMLDPAGNMLLIEHANPIYYDNNHLTDYGSIRFREVFMPLIKNILAKQQAVITEEIAQN